MKTEFLVELTMRVAPRDVFSAAISLRLRGARLTNDRAPGTRVSLVELAMRVAPRDVFSAAISLRKRGAPMRAAPEISTC